MADIGAKFVSQKINKIRWKNFTKNTLTGPDTFITGSWDDEMNKVSLWRIDQTKKLHLDELEKEGLSEPVLICDAPHAGNVTGLEVREPVLICDAPHAGNVTGLEFVSEEQIVSSSSSGTVTLYKHHTNSQTLGNIRQWEKLHHHYDQPCPCTCLAVRDDIIVTAGEDGRIHALNASHKDPIRTLGKADSCTITGITFLKQFEFITVNNTGQLKTYDMRSKSDEPAQTLSVTGDLTPLQCVDKHPSQAHIVATGGDDGTLGLWDLRQDKCPVSLLEAHASTMWELKFHRTNPDHLFSCSDDGTVWHWDATQINSVSMGTSNPYALSDAGTKHHKTPKNPWLATEIAKSKMEITSLLSEPSLPINTLDIVNQTLLCGSDAETIYTVNLQALR